MSWLSNWLSAWRPTDFRFATGAPRKEIMELASLAFVERGEHGVSQTLRSNDMMPTSLCARIY
jgi:hypothetical protein